jgi:16S rRNA (cytosine967-C5)-methyltransferase
MSNPAKRRPAASARRRGDGAGLGARRAAIHILRRVDEEGAFADVLLGHQLGTFPIADRRLITRLVLGTLAWRGRLDYELDRLVSRPVADLDPAVRAILRLGLLQLRFMDRVPVHAAVDTAVEIAKENPRTRKACGLVNAVLRRASSSTIELPARDGDEAGYLAVAWSHPRWLVERFIEWFGVADSERLMAANNEAAPNVIRLNLARGSRAELLERLRADGLMPGEDRGLPETVCLQSAAGIGADSSGGLYYPQSEVSQWICHLLAPAPGAVVIDCAAAPGGKATHLAELIGSGGRVLALDVNFSGLRRARLTAQALGHRNLDLVCADLTEAIPLRESQFDFVLLDAPCTGLGTLREHPEIRWRLGPGDPARLAELQSRMLATAAALLRPGGAIVYSVCSLAPEEGIGVVRNFLALHPGFAIERAPRVHPAIARELREDGTMLTRPDRGGRDGFFAARIIRER